MSTHGDIKGAPAKEEALYNQQHPKANRRRNLRRDQLRVLTKWFDDHFADPYPTPEEKDVLAQSLGMEIRQIEHWFTNRRKRHWTQFKRDEAVNCDPE